jgi:hypothetical protein
MLAASINVEAQVGGALNRARDAVQSATGSSGSSETQQSSTTQPAATQSQPTVTPAVQLSSEERAAVEKLLDETKRNVAKLAILSEYHTTIPAWFTGTGTADRVNISNRPLEEVQAFRAAIEARTAENRAIFCALYQVPAGYDCSRLTDDYVFGERSRFEPPAIKDNVRAALGDNFHNAHDELVKELSRYQAIINRAKAEVKHVATIKIDGDFATGSANVTVEQLIVGKYTLLHMNDKFYFVEYDQNGRPYISPASEAAFNEETHRYNNLQALIRKDGANMLDQYEEFWMINIIRSHMNMAQRNSLADEVKAPVPTAQMNDAALTARMLRMAQEAYPTWGIVRLIIVESAWRPETNALGQIIHRRINTAIILPRSTGGYIMRTLSFIEPYNGGGSYGEARPFGIGTDERAVNFN